MICKRDEKDYVQMELLQMQRQLAEMQHKYLQMYEQGFDCGGSEAAFDLNSKRFADKLAAGIFSDVNRNEIQQQNSSSEVGFPYSNSSRQLIEKAAKKIESMHTDADKPANLEHLTRLLKAEISSSIGSLVDGVVKTFVAKYFNNLKEEGQSDGHQNKARKSNHEQQMKEEPMPGTSKPAVAPPVPLIRPPLPQSLLAPPPIHHPFQERNNNMEMSKQHQQHREKMLDKYIHPYFDLHGKRAFDIPQAHLPLFAPHAYYPPTMAKFQPLFVKEPEQTEALPLVVTTPKKKRTKVTDTRLSPRAARAMLQESLSHHHHHHHQQQQQQHHQHHQQPPPSEHRTSKWNGRIWKTSIPSAPPPPLSIRNGSDPRSLPPSSHASSWLAHLGGHPQSKPSTFRSVPGDVFPDDGTGSSRQQRRSHATPAATTTSAILIIEKTLVKLLRHPEFAQLSPQVRLGRVRPDDVGFPHVLRRTQSHILFNLSTWRGSHV